MAQRRAGRRVATLAAAALLASALPARYGAWFPAVHHDRATPPPVWAGPPPDLDRRPPRPLPPPRFRHCRDDAGGTIIGAIAGGLLGSVVAGRGNRGVGTVAGAGMGALAGHGIGRDCR